jgi:hypothetical protein
MKTNKKFVHNCPIGAIPNAVRIYLQHLDTYIVRKLKKYRDKKSNRTFSIEITLDRKMFNLLYKFCQIITIKI